MKLKYFSLLLLSSLILPVCTYASSTSYEFSKNGSSYNPAIFTTDGGVLGNLNLGSCSGSNKCAFQITDSTNTQLCYVLYMTSSSSTINTCDNLELSNGEYNIKSRNSQGLFATLSFDIVGEDSGAGVDSISEGLLNFSSSLTSLVGDLTSSFSNYLPTIILIGFGVLVLFVFRGYIKHASVELFSMYKNRNKSEGRYQNEDVNAMYKDRKNGFIEKVSTSVFNDTYKLSNGKVVDDSADNVYRKANSDVMMGYSNDKTTEEEYYYAFMYREYEARIPRYQARQFRESDRAEGISYRDSVYRAYNDMKQSS